MPPSTTWGAAEYLARSTPTHTHINWWQKLAATNIAQFLPNHDIWLGFLEVYPKCIRNVKVQSIPQPAPHLFRVRSKSNPVPTTQLTYNPQTMEFSRHIRRATSENRIIRERNFSRFQIFSNQLAVSMALWWLTNLFYCSSAAFLHLYCSQSWID